MKFMEYIFQKFELLGKHAYSNSISAGSKFIPWVNCFYSVIILCLDWVFNYSSEEDIFFHAPFLVPLRAFLFNPEEDVYLFDQFFTCICSSQASPPSHFLCCFELSFIINEFFINLVLISLIVSLSYCWDLSFRTIWLFSRFITWCISPLVNRIH